MTRRAVIDREELFETANTMAANGKDVTALSLLNALGGGSLTTIYKYLSEWEAERPKASSTAGSAEIPDLVQNAFHSTWRIATMEAARETAAIKEKAAEEVKAAQKLFDGALDAIQKLESESEQDAAEIEALRKQGSELETALSSIRNDNAALKATNEQLLHQVKSQNAELERLHKTITIADQKLDAANAERESAIKATAQLKGQADTLKSQNTELMNKLAEIAKHAPRRP